MRWILRAVVAASLLLAASSVPAFSADSGTVSASITTATPCITLSIPALDFGELPFNTSAASFGLSKALEDVGSYTNCSVASAKILLRGTDASGAGSAAWALVQSITTGTCPTNVFLTGVSIPGFGYAVGTTDQEIQTAAAGATTTVDYVTLVMPCTGSSGAGTTMSWQYIFTATF